MFPKHTFISLQSLDICVIGHNTVIDQILLFGCFNKLSNPLILHVPINTAKFVILVDSKFDGIKNHEKLNKPLNKYNPCSKVFEKLHGV